MGAIVEDIDVMDSPQIEINAEQSAVLPVIKAKQTPLPGAEERRDQLIAEGLV